MITLVTPVYNDSKRLSIFGPKLARELMEAGLPIRWIVSDDGSSPSEKQLLQRAAHSFSEIFPDTEFLSLTERSFKGGAVYEGWQTYSDSDWFCFVDADGAIDARKFVQLIREAIISNPPSSLIAVRKHSPETPVERNKGRNQSFRVFNSLVQKLLDVRFEDTQCGAKIIHGSAYREVAHLLKERGFAFDLELLIALKSNGFPIKEVPIPWREIGGGKVHPFRHAWPMLMSVLRIRKRSKEGHYKI